MSLFKCKMCSGTLEFNEGDTIAVCEYCGSKQTVVTSNDEKMVNLFNRANRLRMNCEFDKAAGIYENIIAEFPEEAEGYWGLCLCNYGIEYVDDPATARKIPTCHRASFEKLRKDENYEKALENADSVARVVYEDQAKEIDGIMSGILSVSRNEEPYDIFICYKESDNHGGRTPDSVLAQDIYDALTGKGYRVFFSRITLENVLGTQYEPYIFSALNSAKMMLAVGTDYEYFSAVWVKNEWSRFLKLMAKDKSKILIPCYKDMDPYDMPDEFKGLQAQDCGKLGFMQDLTRGIDKIFGRSEKANNTVIIQQSNGTASEESLLERAFIFLEDGKWSDANTYFEKVLDINPKCARAYLGKLMVKYKVSSETDLGKLEKTFDADEDYLKIIKYGDAEIVGKCKAYIDEIKNRIELEKKRKEDAIKAREEQSITKKKEANDLFDKLMLKTQINAIAREIKYTRKNKELTFEEDKKKIEDLKDYGKFIDEKNDELKSLNDEKDDAIKNLAIKKENLLKLGLFDFSKKKEIKQKINELEQQIVEVDQNLGKVQALVESRKKEFTRFWPLELVETSEKIKESIAKSEKILPDGGKFYDDIINSMLENKKDLEKKDDSTLTIEILEAIILRDSEICNNIKFDKEKIKKLTEVSIMIPKLSKELNLPIKYGKYMQKKGATLGNREPVEWKILDVKKNQVLVVSQCALSTKPLDWSNETNITWENCSLNYWLNHEFFEICFDIVERDEIKNVFLLSEKQVNKYLPTQEDKKCVPTEYAIEKGAYTNDEHNLNGKPTCLWWLSTPASKKGLFSYVSCDYIDDEVGYPVHVDSPCVRPAMWIPLDFYDGDAISTYNCDKNSDSGKSNVVDDTAAGKLADNLITERLDDGKVTKLMKFGVWPPAVDGEEKELITWIVLAKEKNKMLVISDKALDCQKYNAIDKGTTWEECSLRSWLNENFLKGAFSANEQARILSTNVTADMNPEFDTNPGNDTTDRIFLLSIKEARKYFPLDEDSKCIPTEYAVGRGAYSSDKDTKYGKGTCFWLLRSPGGNASRAAEVISDGCLDEYGRSVYIPGAVRPAMWITLKS